MPSALRSLAIALCQSALTWLFYGDRYSHSLTSERYFTIPLQSSNAPLSQVFI
ncbi:MAG: hypothetical protein HC773_22545 [Scytonema sp. CRU_2_7]|nr:hypothetical protein [Scytonema sp. CRU_2_7]